MSGGGVTGVGIVLGHQAASSQAFQVGILDGNSAGIVAGPSWPTPTTATPTTSCVA